MMLEWLLAKPLMELWYHNRNTTRK